MAPGISIVLGVAEDPFSTRIDATSYALAKFSVTLGVGLTTAITAPLAALTAPVWSAAQSHYDAMRLIRVTTGSTGPKLESLVKTLESVRETTRASIEDSGSAVLELSRRLGLSGEALRSASTALVWLAKSGGSDIQSTASAAGQAMAAWGVSGDAVAESLQSMSGAARLSSGGAAGLLTQIAQAAPALRASGMSLTQSSDLLASFARSGVPVESAIAGITRALQSLSRTSSDAGAALQQQIESIRSAGSEAQARSQAVEVFGRNGLVMADAIRRGALGTPSAPFSGSVGETFESMFKALSMLKIDLDNALSPLIDVVTRTVWPMAQMVISASGHLVTVAGSLIKAFGALPQSVQDWIVIVGGLTALAGPALLYAGTLVSVTSGAIKVGVRQIGLVGLLGAAAQMAFVAWQVGQALSAVEAVTYKATEPAGKLPAALMTAGAAIAQSASDGVESSGVATAFPVASIRQVTATVSGRMPTPRQPPQLQKPTPLPLLSFDSPPTAPQLTMASTLISTRDVSNVADDRQSGWQTQVARRMNERSGPQSAPSMPDLVVKAGESLAQAYRRHGIEMGAWYGELGALGLLPKSFESGGWWDLNRAERWFSEADRVERLQDDAANRSRFWRDAYPEMQRHAKDTIADRDRFARGMIDPRRVMPEDQFQAGQSGWEDSVTKTIGTIPMVAQIVTGDQIVAAVESALEAA